ncbi:putative gustatory receptor 36c [Drosophila elegans]|uniref:putative gustatory receptor 36c n=1 Tax=Drosophila elegans TaxID=30023 RepID=UPI001BC86876|nr:putative gustatory receptor 36c [Drosophila elegans]
MDLTRNVLRLFLNRPQPKEMARWKISAKLLTGFVTDLLQVIITLDAVGRVNSQFYMGMALQFWMSAILNLAVSQHYLIMLLILTQYQLLNSELRQVVDESKELSRNPPRQGVFMTRCCSLADRLESIAQLQSQLQSIVHQTDQVFGVHGVTVYGGYYMTMVATAYLTYSILKNGYEEMHMTFRTVILSYTWWLVYYLDGALSMFVIFFVLDEHKKMLVLLEERTLFATDLDVRLEESVRCI